MFTQTVEPAIEDEFDRPPRPWPIATLLGVAVSLLLFVGLVLLMYALTSEERNKPIEEKPPAERLKELRASEDEVLSTYRLVDAKKKIVRIPIDRAMSLYAESAARSRSAESDQAKKNESVNKP
jgi:hypothetical protein